MARHPSPLVERDSGRHRDVQRVGAVGPQRDVGDVRRRRPRIAGGRPSRSPPRQRTTGPSRGDVRERLAGAALEGDLRPVEVGERGARRRPREDRAHRRADRLGRPRVGAVGAEDHRAVGQRVGRADDRADVAGVAYAVQVDRQRRRRGSDQRCWKTPITRVPEPSVLTRVEQLRLDVLARPQQRPRARSPRSCAASTRSSPSATTRPSLSRCLRWASFRIVLSCVVVLGGDHGRRHRSRNEKGRLAGRPGCFASAA